MAQPAIYGVRWPAGDGQAWVREKRLAATIHIPPLAGQAMEILAKAIQDGKQPLEQFSTSSFSIPPLETLGNENSRR